MTDIWKKWLISRGWMRLVLVLLYGFATFGIPLNHTCQLPEEDIHYRDSECTGHQLQSDSYVEVHHIAISNQNSFSEKADSHDLYCPACLYSLTSKAFKLCSNTSLCSTKTVVRTQVLPQLSFVRQLEWFCSAPLRAPPCIAS